MPSRKDLLLRLEHLEKSNEEERKASRELLNGVGEMMETIEGLIKTVEFQRKANEKQSKRIKGLKKETDGLKRANKDIRDNLRMVMETTVVPIVAAVVLKSFYKKGMQPVHTSDPVPDNHADIIRRHRRKFNAFGLENRQEMLDFAEVWPEVMLARNATAHEVTGDDVVSILSYCRGKLHQVLGRAFRSLWGISPSNWHNATGARKALVFRDSSDR
ncbi:hypothetical protein C7212DRAFT_334629 [Tuber magnatum]|uniref:Uncharacterized protein n=1 Tax=Tuber magnatum TaxID=42249 RepID=A0A317SE99_9PEZI|nr:hypothetical protein C7212DRAFT_334629 [Tuber magnatum]